MQAVMDYRISHAVSDKGEIYDERFRQFGWRQYLWQREQQALRTVLYDYFSFGPVSCLDFACGTGRIVNYLYPRVDACVGVDVSEAMLSVCRRKLPQVELLRGDITGSDILGGRTFNLITAFRFFARAQQSLRSEALSAICRHLTKDGVLVFNNHRNASNPLFAAASLAGKSLSVWRHSDVLKLVEQAGLTVDRLYAFGVLPGHDKNWMSWPDSLCSAADWLAEKAGLSRWLAQDCIYVCRKTHKDAV